MTTHGPKDDCKALEMMRCRSLPSIQRSSHTFTHLGKYPCSNAIEGCSSLEMWGVQGFWISCSRIRNAMQHDLCIALIITQRLNCLQREFVFGDRVGGRFIWRCDILWAFQKGRGSGLGDWGPCCRYIFNRFLREETLYVFLAAILGDLRLTSVDEFIHLRALVNFVSVNDLAWSVSSV